MLDGEGREYSHWSATPSHVPSNHTLSPFPALIPPCPASTLTKLGHVVDERVSLTVSVQISQLGAAVQGQVVDAEPSLSCTARIEQGTLGGERGNSHPSLTKAL